MHIKTNENTMFENLKMNFVGFFKKNIYDWKGSIALRKPLITREIKKTYKLVWYYYIIINMKKGWQY